MIRAMDALSEVLRLARFTAQVVLDVSGRGGWCVSVPAAQGAGRAHVVLDGEIRVAAAEGEPLRLGPGGLAFLPGGDGHLVGTRLDAPPVALSSLVRSPVAGELVPVQLGSGAGACRWISLALTWERHLAQPLLAGLPRAFHADLLGVPALNALATSLGLHLATSDAPPVGLGARRERLAELVLIEALRRHIEALPAQGTGWLAALNDRYVGRALALVHGRPGEAWTVERLGRQVGLSRSALAERFREVMGEPIFAFLTRWRLQLAAEALRTTRRPIEAIAREAGYESAGAFSHAFKRTFRKPPSVWRKRGRERES